MIVIAGAIFVFVFLKQTRPVADIASSNETQFSVRSMIAEPAPIQPELRLIATVESAAQPTMTSALAADVQAIYAREGQTIPAGELLIQLDPRDAEVQLNQARADLGQAEATLSLERRQARANQQNLKREEELAHLSEAELARLVQLRDKGLVSETGLNQAKQNHQRALLSRDTRRQTVELQPARIRQAEARVRAAEAALQAAELHFERTQITAPFDAVVTRIHAETGARVNPGEALISLYDATQIELVVDIPTRHLSGITAGFTTGEKSKGQAQFGSTLLQVELLRLGRESRGGAVQAWLALKDPARIPIGIRVPVDIQLPAVTNAVAIPESGLYDLSKVFAIQDGRLRSVQVTVHGRLSAGLETPHVVISHPDLQSGTHLLVTHMANAATGLAVRELEQ